MPAELLRAGTPRGRWVILATVLGSGLAMLDATVVGIALPAIGRDFHAEFSALQWIVSGYTLTLSGLLLLGGALGDRLGRRRVFRLGVTAFTAASLLCALAPSVEVLVASRALQGVGAALLTPGSLAILQASFAPEDRGRAIGTWSGLGGIASASGPFIGGWLIAAVSWRAVFFINLPVAAAVLVVTARHVPESRAKAQGSHLDWTGATLVTLGLVGVTYGLMTGAGSGFGTARATAPLVLGLAALGAFVAVERRIKAPMLPLGLFRSRLFTGTNLVTVVVYAALSGALFLLPIELQTVLGYSPLEAGAALLPLTVIMLLLSSRAGDLSARVGPRIPMTVGPLLVAAGMAMLVRVQPGRGYLDSILPAALVLGLGLAATVAPLTTTVLAAAPADRAGIASAVNNDVARAAGLLAVAVLPTAAGLTGSSYLDPVLFDRGFSTAVLVCAGLAACGGLLSAIVIRDRHVLQPAVPSGSTSAGWRGSSTTTTTSAAEVGSTSSA